MPEVRVVRVLGRAWLAVALLAQPAWAQPAKVDAQALMRKSDKQHRLPNERFESVMVLVEASGDKRIRKFETITAYDAKIGDRTLIRFSSPADIKGTALLSIDNTNTEDDEQWLYLPAFEKIRRVGNAEFGDRFVGSDFFYEDLKHREVDDYAYTFIRMETLRDQECYVIEAVPSAPKAKQDSPYGLSRFWMRADILFPMRVQMFDHRMRPMKELNIEDFKNVRGAVWRADKMTMLDVPRKHQTVMIVQTRDINTEVPAATFSPHTLAAR